jgi:hypothetical protein
MQNRIFSFLLSLQTGLTANCPVYAISSQLTRNWTCHNTKWNLPSDELDSLNFTNKTRKLPQLDNCTIIYGHTRRKSHSPEYVVVFMHAVELQFKARQQIHYHDSQCMIQYPCTKARKMWARWLWLQREIMQICINPFSLHSQTSFH